MSDVQWPISNVQDLPADNAGTDAILLAEGCTKDHGSALTTGAIPISPYPRPELPTWATCPPNNIASVALIKPHDCTPLHFVMMSDIRNRHGEALTSQKRRKLSHRYRGNLLYMSRSHANPIARQSIIQNRPVKIKLAGHSPEYDVSLGLLQKHSAYFAKAFDSATGMKEAVEGRIELRDEQTTSETLETFIYWLNEHVIQLPDGSESITDSNLLNFVDVYNFADLYDTRELRNDVVRAYLSTCREDYQLATFGQALHKLRNTSKFYDAILRSSESSLNLGDELTTSTVCSEFPRDAIKVLILRYAAWTLRPFNQAELHLFLEHTED